ncbi:MAG TPA: amidohydrolase family protein [Alphaproteobacteria bacterium]
MSDLASESDAPLRIVDFHNHFVGPSFTLRTLARVPQAQRAFWEDVNRQLTDRTALISSIEGSGIGARVISTPMEFIADADGAVAPDIVPRINDAVAALVGQYPGRLYGLATVDAYSGEAGARELTRAVKELGLRGVFVESAKRGLLPDAREARPTFAAAAAVGVPVFLHPIEDPQLYERFKKYGRLGMRLTRGTINAAAIFALLESGMFEEIPNLRVVVTALALGGLLLAGSVGDGWRLRKDTPPAMRRHVYVDTTGLHPVVVRTAIDLLGADHVLFGSDWPVVRETSVPARMRATFAACDLDPATRQLIASENALKLLGGGVQ